jgi:membrane protein implicated in regulation of membrane protease activity
VHTLFLGCFAFGLIFTVASFLLGALGSGHHLHLPHPGHHGTGGAHGAHGAQISPFNVSTIAAFVTWFGAAGWLLTRYSGWAAAAILTVATVAGAIGGGIVFVTLSRFLMPRLTTMNANDYREAGTVGRLSVPIREGGTGEVTYELGGARRVDGARTVDGTPLEKGTEVLIHRIERGIAYVERWDEFARKNQLPAGPAAPHTGES